MPIFQLTNKLEFPPVALADETGIVAFGGDLSQKRLLLAYRSGIFPWYSDNEPITWWSPDPRFVVYPDSFKIPRSLRKPLREHPYAISFDKDFKAVIKNCQKIARAGQDGTWITDEMEQAYIALHEAGYAHSVEVWDKKKLIGGLYGVSLGTCFFGESMFSKASNASKFAFCSLASTLFQAGFGIIDCQVYTPLLAQFGAAHLNRKEYMAELNANLIKKTMKGTWMDLQLSTG